jgi:ribosome recycling factor
MDTKDLEAKLKAITEHLKQELSGVRTNRPNPKLIEDIKAEYFEVPTPVKQLGSIAVVPPRELQISVWDQSAIAPIAKAIESANLGVSVSVSGNMIRVALPMMSNERRAELVKISKTSSEEARIKVRGARDEANKKAEAAEKAKEISEDAKFNLKKKIQEAVDKTNKDIEAMLLGKIKEIEE